ncbi:phosphatase PAP2 family protein [Corynebacterium sp.]|jgi:hypothetical protein|uniref:phosphatase PAP2 family protein n=1 Tax=Corynebacterium sp. TaxID=1720 RepID=UPI0025C0C231|nr:phosphatase PAP2 family protein [Corynebacterium sp.]
MRTRPLTLSLLASVTVSAIVLAAAPAVADDTPPGPDRTGLVSEFYDWWTPGAYDDTDEATMLATAFTGDVTEAGAAVLARNDEGVQAINHAGAVDPDQALRALEDADEVWTETLGDSLGPVLSGYLLDGVEQGDLPLTTSVIESGEDNATTGTAKTDVNFPRPFLQTADKDRGGFGDRSRNGENDLKGLDPQLDIERIPDQGTRPDNGEPHSAGYDGFAGVGEDGVSGLNQAFPSGHTTYAYGISLQLAELLPELAPEIITRGSEAGNNRIVLGVHYPLDIIGGRIEGHVNTATQLADGDYIDSTLTPAREELVAYLEQRCDADGHGAPLTDCIEDTDANDAGGYVNAFTDPVSTSPVTDRASALTAYEARMTYGFERTSDGGRAPRVPENAEKLLVTAFPDLTDEQRREVLAATEIDSGYPLDASSDGWARINLPAALSSKVTVDSTGAVVKVEPGQDAPGVVTSDVPGSPAGSLVGSL